MPSDIVQDRGEIPIFYRLFLLYIEPVSTIVGAVYAYFFPLVYLELTHAQSSPAAVELIPVGTQIVLAQLGNLYLAFTLNEALVLRVTNDLRVWRTLLLGLLVADIGHLATVSPHGLQIYWEFWAWNAIDWGNIGFVYLGALTRTAFLLGLGFSSRQKATKTA